ncbi:RILP-like protein 1 isoform X3 [Mizuhopecten yessoensis]|uniref:RILP-like protein 1 isoform X3 n=1 Tax=Mizuhopecten yessoensis TaxID=6573 RepID=UPI000B45B02D|nr:RILP-like protein 1 isoform X3 [Mizuhopecten yessoensis]XP_021346309.1 RILP-like protein 1 isoform X3 [Mizuhopecten yessoensis]
MEPYIERRDIMADETIDNISVVDVYDQAAGIGKEFEKLIEGYGVEAVTDLMPKVIKSLEQLETLAARYEKETNEISDLKFLIEKLEVEKNEKQQERLRYEEELEKIEEEWRKETKDLLKSVSRLQEDNRRMKEALTDQKQTMAQEVAQVTKITEEKEIEVLIKLKDTVDKQREDLRKTKQDLKEKAMDCDALESQLEQIVKVNSELRRKNNTHKKQTRTLLEEKVDLETQLADKEQQISHINEAIKEQEAIEEEKKASSRKQTLSDASAEEDHDQVNNLPQDLNDEFLSEDVADGNVDGTTPLNQLEGENMAVLQHKLSTIGKMVIDMKDPNRPRFTLNELRTVLMERNELKTKLIEVEEELTSFKPKLDADSANACLETSTDSMNSYSGEDDLPVQGPINKEPDEKLYPGLKRETGIRKFFTGLMEKLNLPELDF